MTPPPLGALPAWVTPELLTETRAVWTSYYGGKELTDEEVLALLIRVGVLYEILYAEGWSDEESEDADD
ncbi:MAG TPA: hypothetical protein VGR35_06955 [Tepidisphaeraceae bacterium]|nr:hypothetical protein [Tepidisphaeraceae bacterium]